MQMTREAQRRHQTIRNYCLTAFLTLFLIGILYRLVDEIQSDAEDEFLILLLLLQIPIALYGTYRWMKAKSRSSLLTIVGLMAPLGWLILILLKDQTVIIPGEPDQIVRAPVVE